MTPVQFSPQLFDPSLYEKTRNLSQRGPAAEGLKVS